MNAIYTFSFKNKGKSHTKRVLAPSYKDAIEKACLILEDINDEIDLLGLDDWESVQSECMNYDIYVSNLTEDDDD